MWLAIFASEGLDQISCMVNNSAFSPVTAALGTGEKHGLIEQCIRVLTNACTTCLLGTKKKNII